jgi:O-acetyl-ADP-ribose deacetylase (regulator of RNase III)
MPLKVTLQKGDLTTLEVDAIVNATNNDLILGGDISGTIRRVGGPTIQEECNKIGTIPLGEVGITGAGELKFKMIFHAAVLPLGLWADERSIRRAVQNCLKKANEKEVHTIGFPAVGTGAGGFSIDRCAQIMCEEFLNLSKGPTSIEQITVVISEDKAFDAFKEVAVQKLPSEILVLPEAGGAVAKAP